MIAACVSVGLLMDMKGVMVTAVCLGKAHGVLMTDRGHIYTFGPNNKGQCGREFSTASKECMCFICCVMFVSRYVYFITGYDQ